jgi:hypothetical protein
MQKSKIKERSSLSCARNVAVKHFHKALVKWDLSFYFEWYERNVRRGEKDEFEMLVLVRCFSRRERKKGAIERALPADNLWRTPESSKFSTL